MHALLGKRPPLGVTPLAHSGLAFVGCSICGDMPLALCTSCHPPSSPCTLHPTPYALRRSCHVQGGTEDGWFSCGAKGVACASTPPTLLVMIDTVDGGLEGQRL
jgi:hypothetical protein